MPRPKLNPEILRDKRIVIRINENKLKLIKQLCKKEKITVSKFVKRAIYEKHKIIIF